MVCNQAVVDDYYEEDRVSIALSVWFRLSARLGAEGFRRLALLVSFKERCYEALSPIDFAGTGRVDPPCYTVKEIV